MTKSRATSPLILVQDYHFALAPAVIRERLPLSTIVAFWHIPWPDPRDYAICPWGRQLLEGLLGSSIVGFQTPDDCANFIDTVEALLDAQIDRERSVITLRGPPDDGSRLSGVGRVAEPVGAPIAAHRDLPRGGPAPASACRRTSAWASASIGWTTRKASTRSFWRSSGCSNRIRSSGNGSCSSRLRSRAGSVCPPTVRSDRGCLKRPIASTGALAQSGYRPIVLLEAHHEPAEVYRFLRAADLCYVGSLHDGMNLVAKEFVSARDDERGVLILSEFTGAARELTGGVDREPLLRSMPRPARWPKP